MRKEEPSKFHGSPSGNSTFIISILLVLAIVVWGVISGSSFQAVGNAAFNFISDKFGWFYVLSMTGFVVFAAWMGFVSRYRHMRLGPDESRPEYSNVSWFGMLFSAGMGIGLIFWGVAEPLSFWVSPPGLEPGSTQAAQFAFRKVFLHWGLHPWAAYSVLELSIAYFQYRKGFSGLISALFIPLLGEKRVNGALGRIIDILAVFVTITGIGISLRMGAMQINSGLNVVFGIPRGNFSLLIIIIVMAVVYIGAALAGVNKAVQKIGNFNIAAIAVILVAVFLFGPTVDILRCLTESLGDYIQTLPASAMQTGAFGNSDWYGAWTVFYWAWWIAWAPFSAMQRTHGAGICHRGTSSAYGGILCLVLCLWSDRDTIWSGSWHRACSTNYLRYPERPVCGNWPLSVGHCAVRGHYCSFGQLFYYLCQCRYPGAEHPQFQWRSESLQQPKIDLGGSPSGVGGGAYVLYRRRSGAGYAEDDLYCGSFPLCLYTDRQHLLPAQGA